MLCPRCNGLMVVDQCYDLLDDTGRLYFYGGRCVVCGEIVDPLIVKNRRSAEYALVQ